MPAPLQKIRVLDMSRILAGPWAGQLLGDYGADVVKIERPESGDDTRQWGPPWLEGQSPPQSAYFLSANRNKRSVTVNIAVETGQSLIRKLVQHADVLIENFKVGDLARYGLGPDELLAANPRLIYCSISAFGQSGSRAREPGYDAMIQASAGLMSVTGPPPDEPGGPQKVGVAICDIMAGMYATTAILAALNARSETGRGQHIDVPLYDSQVAWLANQNMNYLIGGKVPGRMGTAHPNLAPYQTFSSSDGHVMITVGNDRQFRSCCEALGLGKLGVDARFKTMSNRVRNRDSLIPLLQDCIQNKSTREVLDALKAGNVPAGPVNDIGEVLTNRHAEERKLVREIAADDGTSQPTVSNPVVFGETPVRYTKVPPLLGQHTKEVLEEWLGYSDAEIDSLRRDGAI